MSLVFISNELLSPRVQRTLRIPLQFVCFAYVHAHLYRHFKSSTDTFMIPPQGKTYNGAYVYGAIFSLNDFPFYISLLDAYHTCGKSALHKNHRLDLHHRHVIPATPIHFASLSDLGRLKYSESDSIDVHSYFGNIQNTSISRRIKQSNSYRITDGINKSYFRALYEEVGHE